MKQFKRWIDPYNDGIDIVYWDTDQVSFVNPYTYDIAGPLHFYDDLLDDPNLDRYIHDIVTTKNADIVGEELPVNPITKTTQQRNTGPKNNDGRLKCCQCGEMTKEVVGFTSRYNLCSNRRCNWYNN